MKRYLLTALILLAIGTNLFGQKIVYDKPDFILLAPGVYEILWDGLDEQNKLVAGGIFIVDMRANEFIKRQKITLLK